MKPIILVLLPPIRRDLCYFSYPNNPNLADVKNIHQREILFLEAEASVKKFNDEALANGMKKISETIQNLTKIVLNKN